MGFRTGSSLVVIGIAFIDLLANQMIEITAHLQPIERVFLALRLVVSEARPAKLSPLRP